MGIEHNFMAHQVSALLLQELKNGTATGWATSKLTTKATLWQGIAEWPKPDISFEDRTTGASLGIEFKPPNQIKREYVTGLGQAITYLNDFEFSGLVLPKRASDGFEIAKYLSNALARDMPDAPIAVFEYDRDPTLCTVLRSLQPRKSPPRTIPVGIGRKVFWSYWRDLSNFDLLVLLRLCDQMENRPFEAIFRRFWTNFAVKGAALTWEGRPRKRKEEDPAGLSAERLNAYLAMRHIGLLSQDDRLTEAGHGLLRTGKIYGADSVAFMDMLAYYILVDGQHLELIFWVDEQNRGIRQRDKSTSDRYLGALDIALVKIGVIAPRPSGPAKAHFLRDEPKLWNKLGLLNPVGPGRYFQKGVGFSFNWRKMVSILDAR